MGKVKAQPEGDTFFAQVYEIVRQIPYGKVVSYGQIAGRLGNPRAARQVGWAMRRCPEGLPWQRVVKADGTITGSAYAGLRKAMLEEEGIPFTPDGRVNIQACRWEISPEEIGVRRTDGVRRP